MSSERRIRNLRERNSHFIRQERTPPPYCYCYDYNVEKNYENLHSSFRFPASFLSERREGVSKDNVEVLPLDGEREWSILIAP